jgi:hypothetical protein
MYSNPRLRCMLYRSVLRSRQSSWDATGLTEPSTSENPANVLIDYNKLCDAIYITDWI